MPVMADQAASAARTREASIRVRPRDYNRFQAFVTRNRLTAGIVLGHAVSEVAADPALLGDLLAADAPSVTYYAWVGEDNAARAEAGLSEAPGVAFRDAGSGFAAFDETARERLRRMPAVLDETGSELTLTVRGVGFPVFSRQERLVPREAKPLVGDDDWAAFGNAAAAEGLAVSQALAVLVHSIGRGVLRIEVRVRARRRRKSTSAS